MKAALVILLVSFAVQPLLTAQEWSQWRGPSRDGQVGKLESTWPGDLNELQSSWKVDLAEGYSSPVVSGGRLFTVETKEKKSEVVRCFDVASGEQIWEKEWTGAMKVPFFASRNGSWVRATPAATEEAVYVGGIRDVLVKLDAKTGEEIWRIDFMEREGTELPAFGFASSPLIDGDSIYVQAGCAVAKIDAKTGETKWRAMEDRRAMFGSAFSSPVIATIHGQKQLVAQTRSTLGGLSLETGDVLWSIPVEAFRGMNILTPTVIGNRVFTATYGGGATMFEVSSTGGKFDVEALWKDKKLEGYMSSPVAIDGHIFLFGRDKKFHCLEEDTGKRAWTTDKKYGEYWSLVVNGDRILALDQQGELLLIAASPDSFQVLDEKNVSSQETWAHLGVEGDRLLVRSLRGMEVWNWGNLNVAGVPEG